MTPEEKEYFIERMNKRRGDLKKEESEESKEEKKVEEAPMLGP